MINGVYTINDVKAKECGDLVYAKNDEVAERFFKQAISKSPYPQDFQLLKVCDFDTETGIVFSNENNIKITPQVLLPKTEE